MDISALSQPLSEDKPAGEDLSYSDQRAMIEQAFEQDAIEGADPVNWRDIVELIKKQSEETRDAWLPVYLIRASAKQGNLEGVVTGAGLLAALLESLWPDLHPTIEEYGYQGRKAPCDSLVGHKEFLIPFKRMGVVVHQRLGTFSAEDIEGFLEDSGAAENFGQFRAAVEDLGPDYFKDLVASLDQLSHCIEKIDAILVEQAEGGDTGTNFENLYLALAGLRKAVVHFSGIESPHEAADDEDLDDAGAMGQGDASRGRAISGAVGSREDVARALDLIVEYYQAHEPGSPIPVVLKRVRGWVYLDFMQLLEEIVPSGVNDAKRVLGSAGALSGATQAAPAAAATGEQASGGESDSGW